MNDMLRVTSTKRCPICGKGDWCLVAKDGSAAICARVESPKRIQRSGRDQAGWLHVLHADRTERPVQRTMRIERKRTPIDWMKVAASCASAIASDQLNTLASSLGVSATSLIRLAVGWSAEHRSYTFPMQNASGVITGIRLRHPTGYKFAMRGSRQGLFVDRPRGGGCLLITEGPTDAAAGIDMGFDVIGRPSCNGCKMMIGWLISGTCYSSIIIAADADEPGQRGAADLARHLAVMHGDVRVVTPPAKDIREWHRQGADAEAVRSSSKPVRVKAYIRSF